MAFLPNSGEIILDAVLTDIGRKRMSEGRFRIVKFSAGDDEIDYGLYNKNHPSGNAYSDLEILQTPILEAFTSKNANINYGLVSRARQDLFYFPQLQQNVKSFMTRIVNKNEDGLILLADDTRLNAQGQVTSTVLKASIGNDAHILKAGDTQGKFVFIETGIQDNGIAASANEQSSILSANGLIDRNFVITYDNRFLAGVLGPSPDSSFQNDFNKEAQLNVSLLGGSNVSKSNSLEDHNTVVVNGIVNRVYANKDGAGSSDSSNTYSTFDGPRGAFTALNFRLNPQIPQADYIKYGSTGQNLYGDGKTYDYIDSTVYIEGVATSATLQIPIRIIKVAQT